MLGLFSGEFIFGGGGGGLLLEGILRFINAWVGLDNKNSLKHEDNSLKLVYTAKYSNSPWAYIQEGLLSEGYLRLRLGGGGGLFLEGLLLEFNSIWLYYAPLPVFCFEHL